jgi:hypothetical protein
VGRCRKKYKQMLESAAHTMLAFLQVMHIHMRPSA